MRSSSTRRPPTPTAERGSEASPASQPGGQAPVLVAVAIDAAGPAGSRPYTYHVPPAMGSIEVGEAVLVEFGRRQALGIVVGPGEAAVGFETKPVAGRVRAD